MSKKDGVHEPRDGRRAVEEVLAALREQAAKVQLKLVDEPDADSARWSAGVDPFDGVPTTIVVFDGRYGRNGTIQVRADGLVSGEFFVLAPHPELHASFVEAVDVWGRLGSLSGDLRLVPSTPDMLELASKAEVE